MRPKFKLISGILNFLLPESVIGITLFPFGIYTRAILRNRERTLNHEAIHWKQQLELFIIGVLLGLGLSASVLLFEWSPFLHIASLVLPLLLFYVLYVAEWLVRLPINGKRAYNFLSFEKEAYINEGNTNYLKSRRPFSFLKYF